MSSRVFFVGIKGVGMTPLALIYQELGQRVSGSDLQTEQITDSVLKDAGITVYNFDAANITPDIDLVIYSGAYRQGDHPELVRAKQLGLKLIPQAEALSGVINTKASLLAVCGVGGKTTTSGMVAQVYDFLGQGGWFVGVSQVSKALKPGHIDSSDLFVVEADEYAIAPGINNRPKFDLFKPKVIICTNLAYDHPDIYPNFEATLETFARFFNSLPDDGVLIIKSKDLALIQSRLVKSIKTVEVEVNASKEVELQVIGRMNQLNAQSVLLALVHLGLDQDQIRQGLKEFAGTKRRLEVVAQKDEILYLDDYGHHPDEIKLTLEAVKEAYPENRLIVIFHPHTLSRTKALIKDFASCFNKASEVIVAPIFTSARESDDQSVTAADLAEAIRPNQPQVQSMGSFGQIVEYTKSIRQAKDIVLTLGAGDIYKIHQDLLTNS